MIFAIRTRRVPFFRSGPSLPLTLAAFSVVTVGAVLPATPPAHVPGFQPLLGLFFLILVGMVIAYLGLIELGKHWFYRSYHILAVPAPRHRAAGYRVRRRAARFTTTRTRVRPRPERRSSASGGPASACCSAFVTLGSSS